MASVEIAAAREGRGPRNDMGEVVVGQGGAAGRSPIYSRARHLVALDAGASRRRYYAERGNEE